jgi:two-component system, LytTR family, sensor histidine kinase AlgZ
MAHPVLTDRHRLGTYLLAWLPVALFSGGALAAAEPTRWPAAVALALPSMVFLGFLCLAAWYPSQANPATTTAPPRLAALHLGGAAATTALWLLLAWLWARALSQVDAFSPAEEVFLGGLPLLALAGLLLYLLAVAASYVWLAHQSAQQAQRRALELQITAREAELRALRAQMDPHFLFNALGSVGALCEHEPANARRMTDLLAGFLRSSLEMVGQEEIALGRELQLALAYLQIERLRYGERLKFVHQVDEAAMVVSVPPLLLQPLVENALKHGVARLDAGGTIRIQARRAQGLVYLVVENPCAPEGGTSRGTDLGLENVRRRLEAAYGERALLIADRRRDRFRVELRLPP